MTPYYRCTNKEFCPGQSWRDGCKTANHPERLRCPFIEEQYRSPIPKWAADPRKPGIKDPDTTLPYGVSLWAVQELMKERQT